MQLAPSDFQAWAAATGSEYPATPADKAAVYNDVAAWKASQQAAATQSRGSNAISPLAVGAGTAGLGLAGLLAFNHFRKQGLSEPAAAQLAKNAENQAADTATAVQTPPAAPPPPAATPDYRLVNDDDQNVRPARTGGPTLRGDREAGPTAATQEIRGGRSLGGSLAREQGQYKARTDEGFHNPALQGLDTPQKRNIYLAGVADAHGTDSTEFKQAQQLIAALETTTGPGVEPTSFIAGLNPQQRYGTTTAAEQAATGNALAQSRTKSNTSAQAGYKSRDQAAQRQALLYEDKRHTDQTASLLAAAAESAPGDMGATVANASASIDPLVQWQLSGDDQRPPAITLSPAHRLVPHSRAYITHIPPAASTAAYKQLAAQYQDQGGSFTGLSGGAIAALQNHPAVLAEQQASASYTDLSGQPLALADIRSKDSPIPAAVKNSRGEWVAPLRYEHEVDAQGNPVFVAPPEPAYKDLINPETGNFTSAASSRSRRPIGIDDKKSSVFFLDSDGTYKTYLGNAPVIGKGNIVLSTGLRSDGTPIAESDLAYFPTDDTDFYNRSSISHPFADTQDIELNAATKPDLRYSSAEDQAIKGMLEPLNASDPRFATGVRLDGVSDNWTFGRVQSGGEVVPLDTSGFQSEMESPAWAAGERLKMAMDDHLARSGRPVPEPVAIQWATSLGQEHGVDAASVLRVALGRKPAGPVQGPKRQARALAAGSGDALDRVYNSLGMYAGADAWDLESKVRSGDLKGAAAALASQLPSLTAVNASGLRGVGQDEKLNIVAEGISAGLNDLHVAVKRYPEAASKFGIGTGPGGFGLDAFLKSYVRDWVTVRGLQTDPTGQPTYQVPNDAFEILAHQAHENGHSTLHEVENHIRGAANGLEGALRLDRLVSAAQSTKEGDPNTNGTNFAQLVFDLKDEDLISTQLTNEAAGDVKLSFGTRRNYDATAGFYDRNPNEQRLDDAIDSYTAFRRITEDEEGKVSFTDADAGYKPNAVLAARISGADFKTPEGQLQQQRAKDTQAWITANATHLERQRADLNRGIILGDSGRQSFGRGFVISSDHRGAFLAGDTQGMNTSIREEQFNDGDTTAVDRAQDHEREARLNNQIVEPDGLDVAAETEESAKARKAERDFYAAGMRRGEEADAWIANADATLSRVQANPADAVANQYNSTKLKFKNLGQSFASDSQKLDGYIAHLQQEQAYLGYLHGLIRDGKIRETPGSDPLMMNRKPFTAASGAAPGYGDDYERFSPTLPTPAGAEERQAAIDLDRRTLQHSTAAPYATVMPKEWRPDFNDPSIQIGVTSAARPSITTTGDAAVAAAQTSHLADRGNRGEAFRDDQNFRDHQLVASGYVDRVKAANTAASNTSLQRAREEGSISSPPDRTGVGGSQGIAMPPAAPERAIPDTLRSSRERSVPALSINYEREVARVGHHADYLDKLYALPPGKTPNANLQPVLVGSNRPTPYAEPGEDLLAARVNALRKRGIL